jgi:L-amino acid N-acyltransferase YncA
MSGPTVRPAVPDDAEAITAIYNEGIEDRVATFETRLRDVAEVAGWLDEGRPLLVAERDGRVVGFARVARYSARPVYDGVGEHAVNVAREARGTGLGTRLLDELVGAAERAGIHKLTSRVFSDNAASRAVHRAAGFEEVGIQRRHARLDGRWRDCVLVERLLGDAA